MLVTLIGYRATGKSTIGPALARALGWTWWDSDEEVERRMSRSIAEIFADFGESAFRDCEEAVIRELCEHSGTVLSVGGGAILREGTRQRLRRGLIVWLQACPATILHRMRQDERNESRRPRLSDLPADEEIRQRLAERDPIYASLADASFDTEAQTPPEIVEQITACVRRRWPESERRN